MKYVMLGKTVPEPTNERIEHYVCTAGISIDVTDDDDWKYNLVRIYPMGFNAPRDWSVSEIPVERNKKDNRKESWRPDGVAVVFGSIAKPDRLPVITECNAFVSGMIEANERRMSLAFVRAINPRFTIEYNDAEDEPSYQLYSGNVALKARERFAFTPRIMFDTEDGKSHRVQYREWGTWELIRKKHEHLSALTHEERVRYVGSPIRLSERSIFLIGNYAQHRTSWLVIKVFNL